MDLNIPRVTRFTTRLSRTGNTQHVRCPKPIKDALTWEIGEELIGVVLSNKMLLVMTLEQYFQERLNEERARVAAGEAVANAHPVEHPPATESLQVELRHEVRV